MRSKWLLHGQNSQGCLGVNTQSWSRIAHHRQDAYDACIPWTQDIVGDDKSAGTVMFYKIATDVIVLFHLVWIGFLIFGALLAYKHPWLRALHLAGLIFSLTMQICGWYCPLTYVEQWLRYQQGPNLTYTGSFIAQYAEHLVYLTVSPSLVLALTLVICAGTITLYIAWSPSAKATRGEASELAAVPSPGHSTDKTARCRTEHHD